MDPAGSGTAGRRSYPAGREPRSRRCQRSGGNQGAGTGAGIHYRADFSDITQPGFSQRTNLIASNDNGQSYVASISNPLPNGLTSAQGAAGGMLTYLGLSPTFSSVDGRRPYTQRWSTSIQFEPAAQSVFEIGYIGSRTVRLRTSSEFNPIPSQ